MRQCMRLCTTVCLVPATIPVYLCLYILGNYVYIYRNDFLIGEGGILFVSGMVAMYLST